MKLLTKNYLTFKNFFVFVIFLSFSHLNLFLFYFSLINLDQYIQEFLNFIYFSLFTQS